MERHLTRPQGYVQAASDQLLCLFVLCLPDYGSLLLAGTFGLVSFLLLTFLLMFVIARAPSICKVVAACLKALPLSWVAPSLKRTGYCVRSTLFLVTPEPSLAPSFQRPPPLFS